MTEPISTPKSNSKTDLLLFLIRSLLVEQGMEDGFDDIVANCNDENALFRTFRGLVNVRQPIQPSGNFLDAQDKLLKSMIAESGISDISDVTISGTDPRIGIWQGDITTIATDAIVNAANSKMLGCWQPNHICIDNTIHTFAGVQLRLACNEIMREQGHAEKTGVAKITPAFNLPAKYVIHTVGPIVMGPLTATHVGQLASCYTSCLNLAAENGCESIAFCSISTGVFMFPQEKAAEIAIRTVRTWLNSHPESSIKTVVFDVFSDRSRDIYDRILNPED